MAKKDTDDQDPPTDAPAKSKALTVETVQRLIDTAFVRYDMRHGHLSAEDGERMLVDLKGD